MRRMLLAVPAMLIAAVLVLAGCSSNAADDGRITVVTSTNVWGSVATAVAGDKATVTALFTNGEGDPHEFEPAAADTAKVVDADIVLLNGGHYDSYMERAAEGSGAAVVDAYSLLGSDGHSADEHGTDEHGSDEHGTEESGSHEGHDHADLNEHVFYDLAVVGKVATELGEKLAEKDSANAGFYRDNASRFNKELDGLRAKLAQIKTAHQGVKVAQTEPLAGYLLAEAGLVDAAPAGFTQAVEEGQSPSAADRAALEDLLKTRAVRVLIYNVQAVDPVTEAMLGVAGGAQVPVVRFTETLPDGVSGYVAWQTAQIDALSKALSAPAA